MRMPHSLDSPAFCEGVWGVGISQHIVMCLAEGRCGYKGPETGHTSPDVTGEPGRGETCRGSRRGVLSCRYHWYVACVCKTSRSWTADSAPPL